MIKNDYRKCVFILEYECWLLSSQMVNYATKLPTKMVMRYFPRLSLLILSIQ